MSSKQQSITQQPTKLEIDNALEVRFSREVYETFKQAKVAIAGLGGLGSNIAVMLARTGIGHLHLVDFDQVDITNLNRQAYGISHLGQNKTDALREILQGINPYIKITTDTVIVDNTNVTQLFGGYPIVCEAFDRAENKAMLVNQLLENCTHTKIVAGSGMAGFGSSNEICTKKVMKNLYLCGDGKTDVFEVIGLTSARVSICAGHQANMIIRLILGMEEV
jgi:sulfur carrier protein ThiS adenylyltransferase